MSHSDELRELGFWRPMQSASTSMYVAGEWQEVPWIEGGGLYPLSVEYNRRENAPGVECVIRVFGIELVTDQPPPDGLIRRLCEAMGIKGKVGA